MSERAQRELLEGFAAFFTMFTRRDAPDPVLPDAGSVAGDSIADCLLLTSLSTQTNVPWDQPPTQRRERSATGG